MVPERQAFLLYTMHVTIFLDLLQTAARSVSQSFAEVSYVTN